MSSVHNSSSSSSSSSGTLTKAQDPSLLLLPNEILLIILGNAVTTKKDALNISRICTHFKERDELIWEILAKRKGYNKIDNLSWKDTCKLIELIICLFNKSQKYIAMNSEKIKALVTNIETLLKHAQIPEKIGLMIRFAGLKADVSIKTLMHLGQTELAEKLVMDKITPEKLCAFINKLIELFKEKKLEKDYVADKLEKLVDARMKQLFIDASDTLLLEAPDDFDFSVILLTAQIEELSLGFRFYPNIFRQ